MEPEMRSAYWKASAKLGIGLTLLAAIIGIRMVVATPEGVPAAIEKLDQLNAALAAESAERERSSAAGATDSIVSRLSAGMLEHLPGSSSPTRGGDQLVSCRLNDRTQFMRADDCAMRGGESTVLSRNR